MNRWHELSERTSPAPILLCRKYFISFPFDIPGERSNRPFHNSGKILTFITPPPFSALFFHRFCYQTPPPFFPPRFLKAIQKEGRRTTTRLQSSGGEGRNSHCAPLPPPPPLFSHTRELFLRGGEGSQSMCVRESVHTRVSVRRDLSLPSFLSPLRPSHGVQEQQYHCPPLLRNVCLSSSTPSLSSLPSSAPPELPTWRCGGGFRLGTIQPSRKPRSRQSVLARRGRRRGRALALFNPPTLFPPLRPPHI